MDDERITFKVPKEINDRFKAFARRQGKPQNKILRKWMEHPPVAGISFMFAREFDPDKYEHQMWVSKTLRVKPSVYQRFKTHCDGIGADMRDILVAWMLHILIKAESGEPV